MLERASVLSALVPVRNQTCPVHRYVALAVRVLLAQCCMRRSASPQRSAQRKARQHLRHDTQVCLSHGCLMIVMRLPLLCHAVVT